MRPKFRLLLVPMLASLFLAACDSETNGNHATTDTETEETTATTEEINDEIETLAVAENSELEDTATEEAEEEESVAEEVTNDEAPEAEKEAAEESVPTKNAEELDADIQKAIDQLVAESDIDLENYTFLFSETTDYVEIEVLEKIDAENTPLVGTYRYIIETGELLVSDYLTGEFVPLEELE